MKPNAPDQWVIKKAWEIQKDLLIECFYQGIDKSMALELVYKKCELRYDLISGELGFVDMSAFDQFKYRPEYLVSQL
jgi:hypothetical protein